MTTVTNTFRITINAQPESVFGYVSDLTRHGEWAGGRLTIEAVSPGPVAVGSRYLSRGDVAGQKDRPNELRVTQYEPPARFTFFAKDPDFGEVSHEFTFKSHEGGTLMERIVTVNMPPVMAFGFKVFIHPFVGKPMMDKALAALKTKLESRAAPA